MFIIGNFCQHSLLHWGSSLNIIKLFHHQNLWCLFLCSSPQLVASPPLVASHPPIVSVGVARRDRLPRWSSQFMSLFSLATRMQPSCNTPIGNSDHSSLSAVISKAQAVQNLCVSRIYLKHQINWNTVCGAIQDLPWHKIWLSDNPVEVLNELLSLLVGRYEPTKVITLRNKDEPWFDEQCKHAFGLKQEAHLRWTRDRSRVNWEEFVRYQVRANETYSKAKRQFSDRNRNVLMNVQSPHKWWSTLKSAEFGSSTSLPRSLVRVVDWCVSRLVRLTCCRIILTASSPGRLLICRSLVIRLLVLPPLPSGRERSGDSC